jgi:predicted Zn finger-like uncharacterized protein
MILTCPSCATRYSVDGTKFPQAGRTVRCAKCGHSWHQLPEAPEVEITPVLAEDDIPATAAQAPAAPAGAVVDEPDYAMAASGTRAYAPRTETTQPRQPIGARLAVVAGWIGLIAVVVLIAVSAVRYRQDIAVIWPQSAGVYSSLGLPVNASGIDFRQVAYRRESEDGQPVLTVSGIIINASPRELPVPQSVRVTLSDSDNREIYHWTFKPNALVLTAGQSVPFLTRLSSPPAAARHLEVRFAKDESEGSRIGPEDSKAGREVAPATDHKPAHKPEH